MALPTLNLVLFCFFLVFCLFVCIWLTSLKCFFSYGADVDVVYHAYDMQEFQNQESYRSVKIFESINIRLYKYISLKSI